MATRYPFPIPFGWFCIGYPEDFPVGEPKPLYYFGRHLVGWRDHEGAAHVHDAFCSQPSTLPPCPRSAPRRARPPPTPPTPPTTLPPTAPTPPPTPRTTTHSTAGRSAGARRAAGP